jgi:hypothetical protein
MPTTLLYQTSLVDTQLERNLTGDREGRRPGEEEKIRNEENISLTYIVFLCSTYAYFFRFLSFSWSPFLLASCFSSSS